MSAQPKYKRIYIKGRGMMLEHRYVMEQLIHRTLLPEEQVHHKDGNTENNHPSNLALCPNDKSHKEQHAYGEDELLRMLIEYVDIYGKYPTYKECAEHLAMPHPSTFARVFGSWSKAKKQARSIINAVNEEYDYESIF